MSVKDDRRRVSSKQERDVARRFGARQHAGSGSGHRSHDMDTADALIECKTVLRGKKSITLNTKTLRTLQGAAALEGKFPILSIRLDGLDYVLLFEADYLEQISQG